MDWGQFPGGLTLTAMDRSVSSPLLKCLLGSGWAISDNRHQDCETVRGRGNKDQRHGLVGADDAQKGPHMGSRPSGGSGSDQQPHQDTEIVSGDVDQIALVDIFASAQTSPAHAASVEIMGEGSLDDFRPPPHRLLTNP